MSWTPPAALFDPAVFVPMFVVLWVAFAHALSRAAGWWHLARAYRWTDDGGAAGTPFRFATGSLGHALWPVRYLRCLRGQVGPEGLGLALMAPYRLGTPALWLPWSAIEAVRVEQTIRDRSVTFALPGAWPQLTLRGELGQAVLAACRAARPDLFDEAAADQGR
jgi:hypothetical protein